MVGKIKPRKVIMPSDLTGNKKRTRRSGPVFTYTVDLLPTESYQRLFADSYQYIKEERIMEELNTLTKQDEGLDLQQLNNEKQREVLLQMVKEGKSDEEMGELFGLTQWQVRNLRYKAGIKKDRGGNIHLISQSQRTTTPEWSPNIQRTEPETLGLTLSIRGVHTGEESVRRLSALAALVGANIPDKKYSLSVQLTEILED